MPWTANVKKLSFYHGFQVRTKLLGSTSTVDPFNVHLKQTGHFVGKEGMNP